MSLSDPIADMLTRIRNAHMAEHEVVEMPHSRMKTEIARILKREGYVTDYVVEGGGTTKILRVYLKYTTDHDPAIRGMERVSKCGLRKYASSDELPRVLGGMGIAIMTTSAGIMTAKDARRQHIGGEVVCSVW